MTVAKYLQARIDKACKGFGSLDLTGETFNLGAGITISHPLHITGGTLILEKPEAPGEWPLLKIESFGVSLHGTVLHGPGRVPGLINFSGIWASGAHDLRLVDCDVRNFEYALYFIEYSDDVLISGCTGSQQPFVYPAPWSGLDYGIVTQYSSNCRIMGCTIHGTRHALIFGHGTKYSTAFGSRFTNHGNVQAVAMKPLYQGKPPAEDCSIINNIISGGVNIGGLRMRISNNIIEGRLDYPQTSSAIYAPKSTIVDYNHNVTDNIIKSGTGYPGSKQYGIIYAYCESGEGTPIFTGNRIYVTGDAPVCVGVTGPLAVVDESHIASRGNVIHRLV